QGQGTEKGTFKKDSKGKSACARSGNVVATETVMQPLRLIARWCTDHLTGSCSRGDYSPLIHIEADSAARTKAVEKRQKYSFKKGP
ncbi:MAG: hypothetical protein ACKPKO_54775, partial [Candidatus Fonsibacter sp.]